jgi:hypothetical protein
MLKYLAMANTLAYYCTELITAIRKFYAAGATISTRISDYIYTQDMSGINNTFDENCKNVKKAVISLTLCGPLDGRSIARSDDLFISIYLCPSSSQHKTTLAQFSTLDDVAETQRHSA